MIDGKRAIAVIIGRAGSKGLPGKNSMSIAEQPMICHTIEDARQSKHIDHIYVSTDGIEIAKAAIKMLVEVINRPEALANDTATVDAAVRHAVEQTGDDAEVVVILYANVPVRPHGLIDKAVITLSESNADSVQSYSPVGKYHPYWMSSIDETGDVIAHVENKVFRRQDLPPLYIPDGGVIVVTRESLFDINPDEPHAFLGKNRKGVINRAGDVVDVVDVDSITDARVAEAILSSTNDQSNVETQQVLH